MKHDNNLCELADETGIARYRYEKRVTAVMALEALDPQEAAVICATFLDEIGAGFPRLDYWGDVRADADEWAFFANAAELESYLVAVLRRLENQTLGIKARKRIFAALWRVFTCDERQAFLDRLDANGNLLEKEAAQ